jgi:lysosomal acid lipase/cholesteryl ester hydrolase
VLACTVTLGALCKFSVDTVCGISDLDDPGMIKNLAAHFPAGTSTKDFVHFSQYINNASFARFDYGKEGNMAKYGSVTPPVFDLATFPPIPTALFHGTQDALVAADDFALEQQQLAKATGGPVVFDRTYEGLSHVSWFVGKPAAFGWFADLAALLKKHNA